MDPRIGEPVADLLISGDHVERIAPGLAAQVGPETLVFDVSGTVVIPGLADSHTHAWEGSLRGIAPDADLGNYMAIANSGIARLMTPEDMEIGERVAAAQALNGGIPDTGFHCATSAPRGRRPRTVGRVGSRECFVSEF